LSAQSLHSVTVDNVAHADPGSPSHIAAADPLVSERGYFFEYGLWDVDFGGDVVEETHAPDPCQSDEGAGIGN
jgi:hypothetical protein